MQKRDQKFIENVQRFESSPNKFAVLVFFQSSVCVCLPCEIDSGQIYFTEPNLEELLQEPNKETLQSD